MYGLLRIEFGTPWCTLLSMMGCTWNVHWPTCTSYSSKGNVLKLSFSMGDFVIFEILEFFLFPVPSLLKCIIFIFLFVTFTGKTCTRRR